MSPRSQETHVESSANREEWDMSASKNLLVSAFMNHIQDDSVASHILQINNTADLQRLAKHVTSIYSNSDDPQEQQAQLLQLLPFIQGSITL
jgi:hypothetical protein